MQELKQASAVVNESADDHCCLQKQEACIIDPHIHSRFDVSFSRSSLLTIPQKIWISNQVSVSLQAQQTFVLSAVSQIESLWVRNLSDSRNAQENQIEVHDAFNILIFFYETLKLRDSARPASLDYDFNKIW